MCPPGDHGPPPPPESQRVGKTEAVRMWLLGGFRVSVGHRTMEEGAWQLRKAANLIKLLALAPAHLLHREQAMGLLWPNLGRRAASNNLRQILHAARRVLDPTAGARYVQSKGNSLVLCPASPLWVDVDAFEKASQIARRSREPAAYRTATGLYAGELLPEDRYEEWAENRRHDLRRLYLALLLELASLYEERGEYRLAIDTLRRSVTEEHILEEAHAGLMRLYAHSDRRAQALAQYEQLRQALDEELGTEPVAATKRLREEIATGRFTTSQIPSRPQGDYPDAGAHNLPFQRTSFVGREREIEEIKRVLPMTGLLTLTGVGGSGKTRLALEVARDLVGSYPDGVWLVELAGLSEGNLVAQEIATALAVREQPNDPIAKTLADYLQSKKLLLVLDNCEHLVEATARLVSALLEEAPQLRVMATSRQALSLPDEVILPIISLPLPDPERQIVVDELKSFGSVRLFVERALSIERALYGSTGFTLSASNARTVAEVCWRLEGIPLAIELAAAWVGTLPVEKISERLRSSLRLLRNDRQAVPRHLTLHDTMDWSYGLLTELERKVFERASVFAGGWTLEAAEAIVLGHGVESEEIVHALRRLADKSLVIAEPGAEGAARYRMLEPVRQYAHERLVENEEAEAIRDRHAAFFLALAERAEPELKGPGQVQWLGRLEEDNNNSRAAMSWLLEGGEVEAVVRLGWALWIFWLIHGHQSEGRRWIEEVLAKGENLTTHVRAMALWVQASTYYGLGSPEQLERICQEALPLFRQVEDKAGLANTISLKAAAMMQRGDAERAISLYEEAIGLGREAGEKWGPSGALAHLGSIYLGQGDYEQAVRYFEESLALSREIGNNLAEAGAFYGLALASQGRGYHERAKALYVEGLESSAEAGDKANFAYCLEGLARTDAAQGENERAARLFGAAETSLEAAGGTRYAYAQGLSLRERVVDAIRSRLDEATFSAAWGEGAAMSLGEAVDYALSTEEPARRRSSAKPAQDLEGRQLPSLTLREEEVAVLVARGLTNRQIASELAISEHTVANHVARILRKLVLSSRAQLIAWIAEQRLHP